MELPTLIAVLPVQIVIGSFDTESIRSERVFDFLILTVVDLSQDEVALGGARNSIAILTGEN